MNLFFKNKINKIIKISIKIYVIFLIKILNKFVFKNNNNQTMKLNKTSIKFK